MNEGRKRALGNILNMLKDEYLLKDLSIKKPSEEIIKEEIPSKDEPELEVADKDEDYDKVIEAMAPKKIPAAMDIMRNIASDDEEEDPNRVTEVKEISTRKLSDDEKKRLTDSFEGIKESAKDLGKGTISIDSDDKELQDLMREYKKNKRK
jgi:predicted  nucleic acid-binding Zn-ribbon protein